jgi:uncharacterized membrane protein YbhN (UPF0104 family)
VRRVIDRSQITWRRLVLISAGTVIFALCVGAWVASGSFDASLTTLSTADPHRAAWAAAGFAASLLASACAWRISFAAVGAPMRRGQACASYSIGSLVNTFAPSTLGEGMRAVLFGRSLPDRGNRACTAAGAAGAVAVAKALPHTLLLSAAVLAAGFPAWLLLAPASLPVVAVVAVVFLRRRAGSRLTALGQATATLFREPGFGMRVVGWVTVATAARVAAATAVAASLGIGNPLDAGLLVAAALILAGALPITPGSIGITSGAVSLALAQHGTPMATALAAGVLFHALESAVGVSVGLIAAPFVVRPGLIPRAVGQVALVGAVAITAAVLGASLFTYLPLGGV